MNDEEKEKNLVSLDNCDFSNPSNRLSSPRSLEACYRLGIEPSELYQISLEDFKLIYPDIRSLPKDLQEMRYEAAEKFRNDSIDQVKEERGKIIEEMEKREKDKLNCDDFNNFFTKLLNYYRKEKNKLTNDKDELIHFWSNIENKEKKGLQWENGESDLIEEMELFFNDEEIIERLSNIFYRHTKVRTYHPRPLHDFWAKDLTEINRYYYGLKKHSKDDLYLLLTKYYEQLDKEKKDKLDKIENDKREKQRKEIMDKKREILEKKEEREKRINELAEPKDRYKTGRVMRELQKQFKYDNIIKKMIKNEFKDNKIFKFPEEYAVRDEDEQKDILFKHDLEKGAIVKNKDEKIKQQIEEAYDEYNYKKDKNRPQREKKAEERKQLLKFIKEKVKEYYKKMTKRLEKDKDGIESINIFLNNMYKEMSRKHRNATKLYFKRPRCEVLKKTYKYKKNHTFYPFH